MQKKRKVAVTIGFKVIPLLKAFYGRSTGLCKSRAERWLEAMAHEKQADILTWWLGPPAG